MTRSIKWMAWAFILAGGLLAVVGVAFVILYAWQAVVTRIGEPDQSLVFWYLPILFIGLSLLGAGAALLRRGLRARGGASSQ